MDLIKLFKRKDNTMFYTDSLEALIGLRHLLNDNSESLSRITIDDYRVRMDKVGSAMESVNMLINRFLNNWVNDDDGICKLFEAIKQYVEYYIRLCSNSAPGNFKMNSKYIIDSIATVSIAIDSKIKFIRENKIK